MSPIFGTTYTVRYRLAGVGITWDFVTALNRLEARRRLMRLVPKAHILSVQEN